MCVFSGLGGVAGDAVAALDLANAADSGGGGLGGGGDGNCVELDVFEG